MWKYFRALGYMFTGRFSAAADALQSNKYVMAATYDKSIATGADRFNTVKLAVADLMGIEQTRVQEIKQLQKREEKLTQIKVGAQGAMQKHIKSLQAQGKSKEEILQDGEFIRHQSAHKDAASSLTEVSSRCDDKEADLDERRGQISTYKAELQTMQKRQQELKEEKHEAIADTQIANQMSSINDVLSGIAEDPADKDLQAAREARKRSVAKSKISAELAGNDARHAENEYLAAAAESAADTELDGLLDWGDATETSSDMEDAKLPE